MKKTNTALKALGILASVGLSMAGVASASAWGPERQTFTMENPATYPTFNSITNAPSIGDERNFVRVGEIDKEFTDMVDEVEVYPGRQYLVYIYFHNNASTTFDDAAHNYSGVAQGTRMSSSFSKVITPEDKGTITGTITANNSNPESVWDEAYLTTKNEKVLMRYVVGSAKIYNDWKTNGSVMPISLFTKEGTLIGLNSLNGIIPGCEEYRGLVSYVLEADALGGTIQKSVSKDGEEFGESINIAPGEEATYQLTIENTGSVALSNVTVRDELPEGLQLVPGSVTLSANDSTTPEPLSDNIFGTGYNLGTVGTGNTVYITYKVTANKEGFDCEGTELTNKATLTYDSEETTGDSKEASTTITVTKTDCTPPPEDLDNCETNPALPECQLPEELPSTGPVEVIIALIILAGIGGGGYYFYRTRKTLRTVKSSVSGDGGTAKHVTESAKHATDDVKHEANNEAHHASSEHKDSTKKD